TAQVGFFFDQRHTTRQQVIYLFGCWLWFYRHINIPLKYCLEHFYSIFSALAPIHEGCSETAVFLPGLHPRMLRFLSPTLRPELYCSTSQVPESYQHCSKIVQNSR